MKKIILILILIALFSVSYVNALPKIIDKTDLSNLSSPQEYQSWEHNLSNGLLIDHMNNVTRVGYNWSCFYTGQTAFQNCWDASAGTQISTNASFITNGSFMEIKGAGTGTISRTGINGKAMMCGYKQQKSGANFYLGFDNGACTGNFLGWAKEPIKNKFYRIGDCATTDAGIDTVNSSEWLAFCISAHEGITYLSNGSKIVTISQTADLDYVKANFELTGGDMGAIGKVVIFDEFAAIQNSSKNRFEKRIRLDAPNATFNLSFLKSQGTNFTTFISCNNGTNWTTSTINASLLDCGQKSQDIIYGYNGSMSFNMTSIYLFSVDEAVSADSTAPIVNSSFNISLTNIKINDILNITCNASDETGLAFGNITINFTTGKVIKNYTFSGTDVSFNNATEITDKRGNVLNISCLVTDTSGNQDTNDTIIAVADTTPTFSLANNNTNAKKNEVVQLSALIDDADTLSMIIASWNGSSTGAWINVSNITLSSTANNYSINVSVGLARGNTIGWLFYSNDTVAAFTSSALNTFVIADTTPTFSIERNNSAPKINEVAQIQGIVNDSDTLSMVIFSWNGSSSGLWINLSNSTASTLGLNYTVNATIGRSRNNTVGYLFYSNDSVSSTFTVSSITTFIVANTQPTIPSFVNGSHKNTNKNETINWTSSDADTDDRIRFDVYFSKCPLSSLEKFTTSDLNFTTNMTSEGTYCLNVSVTDGEFIINSTMWNITLDTATPSLSSCNVANGTAYNKNVTIRCTGTDTNLFEGNVTAYKLSTGEIVFSNSTINLTPAYTEYTVGLNVNTTWGEGNYNVSFWFGDTKNKNKEMPSSVKAGKGKSDNSRDKFNRFVFNDTSSGLQINISILINKSRLEPPKDSQNLEVNFSLVDNDFFKLTIAYDTSEENQTTIINFTSNQKIMFINDAFSTHLLFGSGKNRLSYDSDDAVSNFSMNVSEGDKSAAVSFTPKNAIPKNSRLVIDPQVDNLNFQQSDSIIIIDETPPAFQNRSPSNDSTLSSSSVQINISIIDNNNASFSILANFSGTYKENLSKGYINNSLYQHNITLANGFYIYAIQANDTANNTNTTQNFTLTVDVDTTAPIITLASPANNTVVTSGEKPNINFRISSNEDVKNCSLFLSGSLEGNESTQKRSHNFTINSIAGGVYKWNATCYDLANNLGASPTFKLEIGILSGGSGVTPSPSGGGIGLPSLIDDTGQAIEIKDKGYTMTYICGKVKEFINKTPNYDLSSIVLLQEDIRFEINFIIPFTTLKSYIDGYEQFCGIRKQAITAENKTQQSQPIDNDRFSKLTKLNLMSYIQFPFQIDFGKLGGYGKAVGLFDFANIFLPLSVSDTSENPNVVWQGGFRIVPMLAVILFVVMVIAITRIYGSKKKLDLMSNVENIKKAKAKLK